MKNLTHEQAKLLKDTVETLVIMQDEDRMDLFTILTMVLGYLNDHKPTEEELTKQRIIVEDIINKFEIKSMEDLHNKVKDCGFRIKNHRLMKKECLGGIH